MQGPAMQLLLLQLPWAGWYATLLTVRLSGVRGLLLVLLLCQVLEQGMQCGMPHCWLRGA